MARDSRLLSPPSSASQDPSLPVARAASSLSPTDVWLPLIGHGKPGPRGAGWYMRLAKRQRTRNTSPAASPACWLAVSADRIGKLAASGRPRSGEPTSGGQLHWQDPRG